VSGFVPTAGLAHAERECTDVSVIFVSYNTS